ncbi:MAG: GNAT family N-acetyltransferase [Anaerolineaceae bacterium]
MDPQKQPEKARVIGLGLEQVDEAADLLTPVFLDSPLDHYILEGLGPERRNILASSFKMDCLWKLGMGWPLLGVLENGKLAAVALVIGCQPSQGGMAEYQGGRLTLARLQEMEDRLDRSFGPQTCARILEYYSLRDAHKPREPHLYIESLAALPEHRGKGYGGLLIDFISRLSENDGASTGVALDTQDPVNLALYQHFGYRVTGQGAIWPVDNWFLFRPNAQN